MEGSVNVMGRKGGTRLFPTLTLTLTFHHPEQSLLHKLHWLDHVIRVGVYGTGQCGIGRYNDVFRGSVGVNGVARATYTNKHNYPCKKGSGRLTLTYSK